MSLSRSHRTCAISAIVVALAGLLAGFALWFPRSNVSDNQAAAEPPWFEDVTDAVGLNFVHDAGELTQWQLPQIHGSGAALFDYDGDGRLDLYLLNFGGPDSKSINRLYRNVRGGTLQDVTEGSGLGIAGYNTGVIVGDLNNDGWQDVVVAQYGGAKLFLNKGNGTFADVTEESGVKNPLWGTSTNLLDFDRDGWLDLVIVNFVEADPQQPCHGRTGKRDYCGPSAFPGTVTKLFRNRGAVGPGLVRFEDVTVKAGLAKAPGPGLGVYCADFNGDGWQDIFVANDGKPNHLWVNQKNGAFLEEAYFRGIAVDSLGQAQAGMGIAVGDVDGDGLFDIYVTHLATERNTLWQQGPQRGQFTDRTARAGLLNTQWRGTGFGTVLADFDQDGWPDIGIVNGAVARGTPYPNPALAAHFPEFSERNQLIRNEGHGKFRDISQLNPALCGTPVVARGLATGDLNGDGALDLVVTPIADRARVYFNVARPRGHWLIVAAIDPRLKRDAYGAEVVVKAAGRGLLRVINPGDSYQCSSDPRAHFGLGEAERIDSIEIAWPDGLSEVFFEQGTAADQVLIVRRGQGRQLETKP